MPTWVPKASAPAHISLADEFLALITGDSELSWLTPWIHYIGVPFYSTAAFCAQGPNTVSPLSIDDFFTPTIGANHLADKLTRIARDRVFGAMCELPATGGGPGVFTCDPALHWNVVMDTPSPDPTVYGVVPANRTHVIFRSLDTPTNLSRSIRAYQGPDLAHLSIIGNFGGVYGTTELASATTPGESIWLAPFGTYNWSSVADVQFCFEGTAAQEHTPTTQPPVIGPLEPTLRTYETIADVGLELDHQEDKLDQIRQSLAYLIQMQVSPSFAPDEVSPGTDEPAAPAVDIPSAALAAVVTVSNIPLSSNVELLEPQRYSRLGRITLGTADGWLPSFAIEHNPQLVVPLPPWARLVRVSVYPPATATVRFLTKL